MSKTLEDLQREMEIAASDLDFEKARQIRDRIGLLRGGAEATDAEAADTSAGSPAARYDGTGHEPAAPCSAARLEAPEEA